MRLRPLAALVVLASIPCVPACIDDRVEPLTCDMAHVGEVLSGTWRLRADGERVGCRDRRLEGDLELELSIPLDVTARAVATSGDPTGEEPEHEADAFVQRIRRADYELNADDMPDELELSGSTVGSCATIVLTERLPGGDSLSYTLDGYIVSSGKVVGALSGEGPESCRVRGSFELTIQ
jgi:hypothetical protein